MVLEKQICRRCQIISSALIAISRVCPLSRVSLLALTGVKCPVRRYRECGFRFHYRLIVKFNKKLEAGSVVKLAQQARKRFRQAALTSPFSSSSLFAFISIFSFTFS
jgi:hypothetical protein